MKFAAPDCIARILHRAVGGDHDDRLPRILGVDVHQDIHAVAVGQGEIEQDQIKAPLADAMQALLPGGGSLHVVPFHFEKGLQRLADLGLIIDDEHRAHGRDGFGIVYAGSCNDGCFRH
jgi:hypothetical protein